MASTVQTILGEATSLAGAVALAYFNTNKNQRYIGPIIAPVVVSEVHDDSAIFTDHPVEDGTIISDHMYLLPQKVDISIIYSQSSGSLLVNPFGFSPLPGLSEYYHKFLVLQESMSLFNINTGKRFYENMQIENIHVVTDVHSENMLKLTIRCRQIIVVSTSTTNTQEATPNNQSNALATASPTQSGNTALVNPSTATTTATNSAINTFNSTISVPVP